MHLLEMSIKFNFEGLNLEHLFKLFFVFQDTDFFVFNNIGLTFYLNFLHMDFAGVSLCLDLGYAFRGWKTTYVMLCPS